MSTDPTDWTEEEEAALRGLLRPEPSGLLEERVVRGLRERGVLRSRRGPTRYTAAAGIALLLAIAGFAAGRWSADTPEPVTRVVREAAAAPDPIIVPADCPTPASPESPRATVPPAQARSGPGRSRAVAQRPEVGDPVEVPSSLEIYRVDADDRERMILYF